MFITTLSLFNIGLIQVDTLYLTLKHLNILKITDIYSIYIRKELTIPLQNLE